MYEENYDSLGSETGSWWIKSYLRRFSLEIVGLHEGCIRRGNP